MGESLPVAGYYVDDSLKSLFVEVISQLISDLGRTITLYMPPTYTGCPNCLLGPDGKSNGKYDVSNPNVLNGPLNKPFASGSTCPVCKNTHQITTANTVSYTATISRAPKDIDYSELGIEPSNVYGTKLQICAFDDLRRCEKVLIDGEYCVRLRDPIKTGLKDLSFVRCWWKKLV